MKTYLKLINCLTEMARAIVGVTRYAGMFIVTLLSPKAALAARVVALESQLAACRRWVEQKDRLEDAHSRRTDRPERDPISATEHEQRLTQVQDYQADGTFGRHRDSSYGGCVGSACFRSVCQIWCNWGPLLPLSTFIPVRPAYS